jgi:hypothetical protein
MAPTIKQRIAREWLIFLVCILIGLTATYFAIYFPVQYVGQHFVDVTDAKTKDFLNEQYRASGIIPEGYRTTNSLFNPPKSDLEQLDKDLKMTKDRRLLDEFLANRQYYTYDWERETDFFRRKNPGELFSDLGEGHLWLWLFVLSPYFVLSFVRSIIWSVNALRRPKQSSP